MLNDQVSRYLPNKVESLELHDVSLEVAAEYVVKRLQEDGTPIDSNSLDAIAVRDILMMFHCLSAPEKLTALRLCVALCCSSLVEGSTI